MPLRLESCEFEALQKKLQIRLFHHIHRSFLRLVKYPADILSKYADGEQLDTTEEEHDGSKGSETLHLVTDNQLLAHIEQDETESEKSNYGTNDRGKTQRSCGERGDALNGKIEETPEIPATLTCSTVASVKHHLFLLKAYPTKHTLGVSFALTKFFQCLDALAVEQTEISHILQHVKTSGIVEYAIEQQRELLS